MNAHNMINTIQVFSALAYLVFATISPAQAAIVTENLGEPNHAAVVFVSNTGRAAMSFTTDATAYALSSITMQMQNGSGFVLSLYDNNVGVPGTLIDTLSGPSSFAVGDALYAYTPTTTVLLQPSTTYFVVGRVTGGPGEFIHWRVTPSAAQTGPGTIGDFPLFSQNGVIWTNGSLAAKFRVEGTVVPEPSSVLFLGLVGIGLLVSRSLRIADCK